MSSFWFDPMVQTAGMPGYGGGPQVNTDYGGQLAQQQAYVAAQQPSQAQLYGGGSFGAQPAAYAALGAAYGRATGGFNARPGAVGTPGGYDDAAGLTPSTAPNGGGGDYGGTHAAWGAGGAGDIWSRGAPSSGVVGGWYDPYGGGGGYPAAQFQTRLPQNWQKTFNNTVHGDPYDPTPLGDSSWYPSQRTPYSGGGIGSDAHRGGQEGQSYSGMTDWRGNPIFNPGTYAGDQGNYGIPFNNRPMAGDIGFSKQPTMPNLGYNPGMANSFANPGMNANPFQNRFGMGFPNAGTPSQYAPGAQMPPGFRGAYSVDDPNGALPLNTWGPGGSYQPGG